VPRRSQYDRAQPRLLHRQPVPPFTLEGLVACDRPGHVDDPGVPERDQVPGAIRPRSERVRAHGVGDRPRLLGQIDDRDILSRYVEHLLDARDGGRDDDAVHRCRQEMVHRTANFFLPPLRLVTDLDLGVHERLSVALGTLAQTGQYLCAAMYEFSHSTYPACDIATRPHTSVASYWTATDSFL